ncbi:hypothetical protein LV716_03855 [Flagellimonas sp. HMM57]|uniref:hypothetical protein n=1 Tax=unclassified Flagellimonas TaxID=2644544 RepID=UPI0013D86695|nr:MULTISPECIES: hypothetical protein [unclassified Flagellimonas]UII76932.1 hypothetical protein LV716_03855 [Flagellimonas sp. HMM57]
MDNIFDGNEVGIGDFMITEVFFDTTSTNLTFNYSFTVAAANNDSGNGLDVSGSVNVFVLGNID